MFAFGNPQAGTTQALEILHEASRTKTVLIDGTKAGWKDEAREAVDAGAVALVDGKVRSSMDIQDLFDSGLVGPGGGSLIRFWSTDGEAQRRASEGSKEVTQAELDKFRDMAARLDARIQKLGLPYYMIPNEFGALETAVGELARRAGVTS